MARFHWLVAALATLAVAAPPQPKKESDDTPGVEPPRLTLDDFDSSIAQGTWFLKFYSPYCWHCNEFAPTWKEFNGLIHEQAAKEHNFHLASVNCVEQGDLCDKEEIAAYPNLRIYENGKSVYEHGAKDRTIDDMKKLYEDWVNGVRPGATTTVAATKATKAAATTSKAVLTSTNTAAAVPVTKNKNLNPDGVSVNFNQDEFYDKVVNSADGWLIKFHSPRCPHCLEMKPAWTEMAKNLRGTLNVGEVNCDTNQQLCKEQDIDLIPNVRYFDNKVVNEYKGVRNYDELLAFAKSAADAQNIHEITEDELKIAVELADAGGRRTGRVTTNFLYLYDDSTVIEDFEAVRQMAVSVIGNARVFKSSSSKLAAKMKIKQLPALVAVTDVDRWIQYPAKSPKDIRDIDAMVSWAKQTWLSLVPQLSPANADEILSHAKYVVLAVIDPREIEDHERAIKEMKATALTYFETTVKQDLEDMEAQRAKKQVQIDEAKDAGDKKAEDKAKNIKVEVKDKPAVGFAWIDQVFYERWIKGRYGHDSTHTKPRAIINDESGSRYWDVTPRGKYIEVSRSQLLDTLDAVLDPKDTTMQPKALHNGIGGYFIHLKVWIGQYWHLLTILVLLVLLVRVTRGRRGHSSRYHSLPVQEDKLD